MFQSFRAIIPFFSTIISMVCNHVFGGFNCFLIIWFEILPDHESKGRQLEWLCKSRKNSSACSYETYARGQANREALRRYFLWFTCELYVRIWNKNKYLTWIFFNRMYLIFNLYSINCQERLQVPSDDALWMVNMRKGIASTLRVPYFFSTPGRSSEELSQNSISSGVQMPTSYQKVEETMHGKCLVR